MNAAVEKIFSRLHPALQPERETFDWLFAGDKTETQSWEARDGLSGEELKQQISSYLEQNKKSNTTLAGIRSHFKFVSLDAENPLSNPVHRAVKELRDSGHIRIIASENSGAYFLHEKPYLAATDKPQSETEKSSRILLGIYGRKTDGRQASESIANRIAATGTSEGVRKSWEIRHLITPQQVLDKVLFHDQAAHAASHPDVFAAHMASREAYSLGEKASEGTRNVSHNQAEIAHLGAATLHQRLGNAEYAKDHLEHASFHGKASADYFKYVNQQMPKHYGTGMDWRQKNRAGSIEAGSDD